MKTRAKSREIWTDFLNPNWSRQQKWIIRNFLLIWGCRRTTIFASCWRPKLNEDRSFRNSHLASSQLRRRTIEGIFVLKKKTSYALRNYSKYQTPLPFRTVHSLMGWSVSNQKSNQINYWSSEFALFVFFQCARSLHHAATSGLSEQIRRFTKDFWQDRSGAFPHLQPHGGFDLHKLPRQAHIPGSVLAVGCPPQDLLSRHWRQRLSGSELHWIYRRQVLINKLS